MTKWPWLKNFKNIIYDPHVQPLSFLALCQFLYLFQICISPTVTGNNTSKSPWRHKQICQLIRRKLQLRFLWLKTVPAHVVEGLLSDAWSCSSSFLTDQPVPCLCLLSIVCVLYWFLHPPNFLHSERLRRVTLWNWVSHRPATVGRGARHALKRETGSVHRSPMTTSTSDISDYNFLHLIEFLTVKNNADFV